MKTKFITFLLLSFVFPVTNAQVKLADRESWDPAKQNTKELNALLKSPLNLQAYKKLKPWHSNNGGANRYDYFYKPDYKGFYYFYFIFPGFNEHGPRITTYKTGNRIGGYMDSTEVFIQLSCDREDKDLGRADLLIYSESEVLKKFGDNYLKQEDILIYQYEKTLLILSFSKDRWFKIVKLNKPFRNFTAIKEAKNLLSYF